MYTSGDVERLLQASVAEFAPDWEIVGKCWLLNAADAQSWPSGSHSFQLTLRHRRTGKLKVLGRRSVSDRSAVCHRGISLLVIEAYRERNTDPIWRYFEEIGVAGVASSNGTKFFKREVPPAPAPVVSNPIPSQTWTGNGFAANGYGTSGHDAIDHDANGHDANGHEPDGNTESLEAESLDPESLDPLPEQQSGSFARVSRHVADAVGRAASTLASRWLRSREDSFVATFRALESAKRLLIGTFSVLDVMELIQTISLTRKTGRLAVSLDSGTGVIELLDGRAVHAEFAGLTGERAFIALATAAQQEPEGRFCFHVLGPPPVPTTIRMSMEELLLATASALDANRRGAISGSTVRTGRALGA